MTTRVYFLQQDLGRTAGYILILIAFNCANDSRPLDSNSMQILFGPAKLREGRPFFAIYLSVASIVVLTGIVLPLRP